MKIGLTGSIACGKSTVAAYLHSLGYAIVDADAISRALTAPGGAAPRDHHSRTHPSVPSGSDVATPS